MCKKTSVYKIFLYDNSCNMHKHALRRGAKDILKFNLFTDRHHWKNHTGCSESYNCDRYDYLKTVNSQICEQKNCSLRKLSSTLAYCGFENYMTKVKLFLFSSSTIVTRYRKCLVNISLGKLLITSKITF